jgi:lipopolysaccharide transport system permease protein
VQPEEIKSTLETQETWDLEIKPRRNLFSINVGELLRYRDLIVLFVRRDFVSQYKQTVMGPLWHLIQPILTTLVFLLVFGRIARIGTDGIPPILFYITGITLWTYFSGCLTATANTFIGNASIFGKVYFPRLVTPISITLSNLIKLAIQLALVVVAIVYYHFNGFSIHLTWKLLFLPFIIMAMAGISLGLGIIISSLTTKYRDLSYLLTFAVQLAMYATPVAYPLSFLKDSGIGNLLVWNPLSTIFESFRYCLYGSGTLTTFGIAYSVCFMLLSLIFGVLLFNKVESTFMDTV